jgi:DHA1 family inner membrane transport protein
MDLEAPVAGVTRSGAALAALLTAACVGYAPGAAGGGRALDVYGAGGSLITGLVVCTLALPAAWATAALRAPRATTGPVPSTTGAAA